jgi:glyoxylase-like metal-dependent hydrolase (beta-lactamase superfamily II)
VLRPRASREAAVIDPGATPDAIIRALATLDAVAVRLLLTHGHHDHATHARAVSETLGLPLQVHPRDRRLVLQAAMYSARLSGRVIRTPQRVEPLEGATVSLGTWSLRVHEAPGHTPGGVVFVADGLLVTGDTLLRGKVGRTDLPGGDATALRVSVDGLLDQYLPQWQVLPGHGAPWTVGEARTWWRSVRDAPPALNEFDA